MIIKNIISHKKCLSYFRRIVEVLGGMFIFLFITYGLNYIYVDTEERSRIVWRDFYENRGKIDNVYIGSSHVYLGIDPLVLDEINGGYNFNLSTSAQHLDESYYLLKEADKYNPLSCVYIELYYLVTVKDNFSSYPDWTDPIDYSGYNNVDNMKISLNKIEYIYRCFGVDKFVDVCFPFVRYRSQLGNWDYVKQIIEKKHSEEYTKYIGREDFGDSGYMQYVRRGYFDCTKEYNNEQRLFFQSRILSENPMGEKSEKYLKEIICYCLERKINVILFISPINELQLISTENYDNYVEQVRKIAGEYDVEFYDFNLAKEEYLPIQQGEYFRDAGHLNSKGADMFTPFLGETVSRTMVENENYFYDSYEEKLRNISPRIYGLYYRGAANDDNFYTYHIASNREEGMEYRVIITPDEGERYVLQDFSENREFDIPVEEHGICSIIARIEDTSDNVQTLEIKY